MFGAVYVTHQAMKLAVTLRCPTRQLTSQRSDSTQQVEPCHSSTVEALHKNASSMFGKPALDLGLSVASGVTPTWRRLITTKDLTRRHVLFIYFVILIQVPIDNWRSKRVSAPRPLTHGTCSTRCSRRPFGRIFSKKRSRHNLHSNTRTSKVNIPLNTRVPKNFPYYTRRKKQRFHQAC